MVSAGVSLLILAVVRNRLSTEYFLIVFLFFYFVYNYLGNYLIAAFRIESGFRISFYDRPHDVFYLWVISLLCALSVTLAYSFSVRIGFFSKQHSVDARLIAQSFSRRSISHGCEALLVFSFLVLSLVGTILYTNRLEEVPILSLFRAGSDLRLARSNAGNAFQGRLYLFDITREKIPFIIFFYYFFKNNKSKFQKILIVLLFFYNIFLSVMLLQKAPPLIFSFFVFVAIILKKKYVLSFKVFKILFIISSIFFAFAVLLSISFRGSWSRDLSTIALGVARRIVLGQVTPQFHYLRYIGEHGILHGRGFPNPGGILPFEHVQYTKEVMAFANPILSEQGIVGSMPTIFYGQFIINFGRWAAIPSSLFFGFILGLFGNFFRHYNINEGTPLLSAFFVYYLHYLSTFAGTGFANLPISPDFWLPIILVGAFTFVLKTLRYKTIRL